MANETLVQKKAPLPTVHGALMRSLDERSERSDDRLRRKLENQLVQGPRLSPEKVLSLQIPTAVPAHIRVGHACSIPGSKNPQNRVNGKICSVGRTWVDVRMESESIRRVEFREIGEPVEVKKFFRKKKEYLSVAGHGIQANSCDWDSRTIR